MERLAAFFGRARVRAALVCVTALAVSVCVVAPAGAAKAKKLSQGEVDVSGSTSGDWGMYSIATGAGYFQEEGLNKLTRFVTTSTPNLIAAVISGDADFFMGSFAATLQAKSSGGPLKVIMNVNQGGANEIVINADVAKAKKIPTSSLTSNDALAQFKALKGSKLRLAVPSITGSNYTFTVALAKANGMTVGPDGDFVIESAGSGANMKAAYAAGRYDGYITNAPDTLTAPNATVGIPLYKLHPVTDSASTVLVVTEDFIKKHKDTIQAFVNGLVRGALLAQKNPESAVENAESWIEDSGLSNTNLFKQLFSIYADGWNQPAVTKKAFGASIELENSGALQPTTVKFDDIIDNTFVNKAIKKYNLEAPIGPLAKKK